MKPDILFYQQYATPYFGILSIAAHLKNKEVKTDVIIDTLEHNAIDKFKQLQPKVIGISVTSPEHKWLIQKTKAIRQALPEATIIAGGIHAIFYPKRILSESSVDLVCHSEGEQVILKVLEETAKPAPSWESIEGLSFKDKTGQIHCNERAGLTAFSDEIIEDRSIYYNRYPLLAKDTVHRFFSSRGCPYECSFCYNADIRDIFKEKGQYVRQKSVKSFIQEISSECEKYSITSIFFYDDLFTFNKRWLEEFLEIYEKKINIPFMCTARANLIDEKTVELLAKTGCRTVSFGVETGNAYIRNTVLKKSITDEQIIRCGNLLHKYGIKVQTANMFCLPGESIEDALKTIELNIKSKTDCAFTSLFMPFPDTALAAYCVGKGLLNPQYSLKDIPRSFLTSSILLIPKKQKEIIKSIHRLAYFFIKWPWFFKKFKNIIYFTFLTPVFDFIFLLGNFFRHQEERGISMWAAIKYAWRMRKSF